MIHRREFGRQAFRIAASFGLTSFSLSRTGSLLALGACGDDATRERDAGESRAAEDAGMPPEPDAAVPDEAGSLSDARTEAREKRVLIIGTGYGSAVTALRLTEAGVPVTMLEAGRLWNEPGPDAKVFCKPFSPDGRAMWFRDKVEAVIKSFGGIEIELPVERSAGVLEARGPESMRVYQGRGVGGGSLVNMALYLAPDREKVKTTLPMVDADEFIDKYIVRAQRMLRSGWASPRMLASDFYTYSRAGLTLAQAAGFDTMQLQSGYDFDYMDKELDNTVPRSALAGEAGFGNNYGKRSLDKTYLADALGTGNLTIHALHEVKRIRAVPEGGYVVNVDRIDVAGNVLESRELTCTHLFVGAGSMATSELLVRARERGDLPDLRDSVGTKWGPNGDLFVALETPIQMPTGSDHCTIPSHAIVTRDPSDRRVVSEFVPFPSGLPSWQLLNIVIAENPEAGHFTYDSAKDSVDLVWAYEQNAPSIAAAKHIFDKMNMAGGSRYSSSIRFDQDAQFGDRGTYHPLGGVPLGEATDDYGRIREYPNLYVVDGSLIPIGIGANPSLSITALAERNIEHVLKADFST